MQESIVYLMSGQAHLPYLAVSLRTLREYWKGMIRVYAWPESFELVKVMSTDDRLGIEAIPHEPAYRARRDERRQGKNDQFISKLRLVRSLTEIDSVLYLDADTSVHGDLAPLFQSAQQYTFAATRFSSWTTAGGIVQNRIKRLLGLPKIDQGHVKQVLQVPWPSLNGGVFCCSPKSPTLKTWEEWTWEARHVFIADEAVLHVLQPKFLRLGQMYIYPDGRFNCSCNPKWAPEGVSKDEIIIWHYHGDSNVRPAKHRGHAYRRWWPMWQQCLVENIGSCREWAPSNKNGWLGNRWFEEMEV